MIPRPPISTLFPYTTLFRSMEGMAEYLSVGPIDPHTAMWLRDAALEGHLRSEEHTSELQSHHDLVCRLLLEKKNSQAHKSENIGAMSIRRPGDSKSRTVCNT